MNFADAENASEAPGGAVGAKDSDWVKDCDWVKLLDAVNLDDSVNLYDFVNTCESVNFADAEKVPVMVPEFITQDLQWLRGGLLIGALT